MSVQRSIIYSGTYRLCSSIRLWSSLSKESEGLFTAISRAKTKQELRNSLQRRHNWSVNTTVSDEEANEMLHNSDGCNETQGTDSTSSVTLKATSHLSTSKDEMTKSNDSPPAVLATFLNVMRLRCVDANAQSYLQENISQKHLVEPFDMATIYRIIHNIYRYTHRKNAGYPKVKRGESILFTRVNELVRNNLNKGIRDMKLRTEKNDHECALEREIKHAETYTKELTQVTLTAGSPALDLDSIWKLWYLLKSRRNNDSRKTKQLLQELLVSRNREIHQFDLGRTLRSLTTMVQSSNTLTLAEEKWTFNLFEWLWILLSRSRRKRNPQNHLDKVSFERESSNDAPRNDTGNKASAISCEEVNTASYPSIKAREEQMINPNILNSDVSIKQGNIYLTIDHVHSILELLSAAHRKFSRDHLCRLMTKNTFFKGFVSFTMMADEVVTRSFSLEARLRASAKITKLCTEITGEQGMFPYTELQNKHLRIVSSMLQVLKQMDSSWLPDGPESTQLEDSRNKMAELCFKFLQLVDGSDIKATTLYVIGIYHLLLSSILYGTRPKPEIDEVLPLVIGTLGLISQRKESKVSKDTEMFLLWVERLLSLTNEIGITSPAVCNLVACQRRALKQLTDSGLHCSGVSTSKEHNIIFLTLLQKSGLLNDKTLLRQIKFLGDHPSKWAIAPGSHIAMTCDILICYYRQLSHSEETERICHYAKQLLNKILETCEQSPRRLMHKLNNEQLLSVTDCFSTYLGSLPDTLVKEAYHRAPGMTFGQCMKWLRFGNGELLAALEQRIRNLLKRKEKILDLSPALAMLNSYGIDQEQMNNDLTESAVGKHHNTRSARLPAPPSESLKRLLSVIMDIDRDIVILSESTCLKRRLEKRFHRSIGATASHVASKKERGTNIPVILSQEKLTKFMQLHGTLDGLQQSNFYNKIKLAGR